MTQRHVDYVAHQIGNDGVLGKLADFAIPEAAVLALDDAYQFLPEDAYCPLSDVPDWVEGVGVHVQGDAACIAGDNGLPPHGCLFVFMLLRATSVSQQAR